MQGEFAIAFLSKIAYDPPHASHTFHRTPRLYYNTACRLRATI
jgi:hypothetical protein